MEENPECHKNGRLNCTDVLNTHSDDDEYQKN